MAHEVFTFTSELPAPAAQVFAWHERPGAFERLAPPWQRVQVLKREGGIRDGGRLTVRVYAGPWPSTWEMEHHDYIAGRQFADRQISGPFAFWNHQHLIEPIDETRCRLTDRIEYAPPMGSLGKALGGGIIQRELQRTFAYRHQLLKDDLHAHQTARGALGRPLRIAIAGAHGLIGTSLGYLLTTGGHEVVPMVRTAGDTSVGAIQWRPEAGTVDAEALSTVDAVVNLAGEPILGRWSETRKKRIRDSRVEGTRLLAQTLARAQHKPRTLVCASAIGYFGDRGEEELTEQSDAGAGFLAEVCQEWEAAAKPAAEAGIRVAHTRFGLVLHPQGGALKQMLPPFRLGLGGVIGSGKQYWSWISLNDVTAILYRAIYDDALSGPINLVSPQPVTQRHFAKTLNRVLGRPTILSVPRLAAKLAIGELAEEGILASQRVFPQKLIDAGYAFHDPQLEPALRQMLGTTE